MVRGIRVTYPKARKKYVCRACENMLEGATKEEIINSPLLSEEESEIMRKAIIDDKGCIQIGEVYECQYNESDGDVYYYRAKKEVLRIANLHNLLSQDE